MSISTNLTAILSHHLVCDAATVDALVREIVMCVNNTPRATCVSTGVQTDDVPLPASTPSAKPIVNAYIIFCQRNHDSIVAAHPHFTPQQVTAALASKWNAIKDTELSAPYRSAARENKVLEQTMPVASKPAKPKPFLNGFQLFRKENDAKLIPARITRGTERRAFMCQQWKDLLASNPQKHKEYEERAKRYVPSETELASRKRRVKKSSESTKWTARDYFIHVAALVVDKSVGKHFRKHMGNVWTQHITTAVKNTYKSIINKYLSVPKQQAVATIRNELTAEQVSDIQRHFNAFPASPSHGAETDFTTDNDSSAASETEAETTNTNTNIKFPSAASTPAHDDFNISYTYTADLNMDSLQSSTQHRYVEPTPPPMPMMTPAPVVAAPVIPVVAPTPVAAPAPSKSSKKHRMESGSSEDDSFIVPKRRGVMSSTSTIATRSIPVRAFPEDDSGDELAQKVPKRKSSTPKPAAPTASKAKLALSSMPREALNAIVMAAASNPQLVAEKLPVRKSNVTFQ